MAVEREQTEAVIEDDGIAVDAEVTGKGNGAAVRRFDRIVLRYRQVVAEMIRGVDRLLVVDVRPLIGEVGFDLGVAELAEGVFPEYRRGRFAGDLDDLVFVLAP